MAVGTINRAQSEQRGRVVRGQGQGQRQAKMNSKSFCAKVLTTILVICSSRQRAWAGLDWPGLAGPELNWFRAPCWVQKRMLKQLQRLARTTTRTMTGADSSEIYLLCDNFKEQRGNLSRSNFLVGGAAAGAGAAAGVGAGAGALAGALISPGYASWIRLSALLIQLHRVL